MSELLFQAVGEALRRARLARGMTLREVAQQSRGKFKSSAVGLYERGERRISLETFCRLSKFYGVLPDRLLAQVLERVESRSEAPVALNRLRLLPKQEALLLSELIHRVKTQRQDFLATTITLRAGDIEALAMAARLDPRQLRSNLGPALRNSQVPEASRNAR